MFHITYITYVLLVHSYKSVNIIEKKKFYDEWQRYRRVFKVQFKLFSGDILSIQNGFHILISLTADNIIAT